MGRRGNYFKFTGKTHSKKGIAAFILSALLLVVYGLIVGLAYLDDGGLSMYYGSIGICALIVSFVSFVLAVQSLGEENSFQFFPRIATFVSIITLAGWVGTYVLGFLL